VNLPLREVTSEEAVALRRNADILREGMKKSFGVSLGFDRTSLDRLDGLIDEGWDGELPEMLDEVVEVFGSFIGEAIIADRGGNWMCDDERDEFCVSLPEGFVLMPFTKVRKRFENGRSDSISFFVRVAGAQDR
jgi:hypothetical protein